MEEDDTLLIVHLAAACATGANASMPAWQDRRTLNWTFEETGFDFD